ncbi:MAG: ATP-binding protein [Thermoanaerobaculia bacterium]
MTSQESEGPIEGAIEPGVAGSEETNGELPEIDSSDGPVEVLSRPGRRARFRAFMARRGRFWLITLPLHLFAFWILYFATVRITEMEVVSLARETAEGRLNIATRELNQIAVAHTRGGGVRHMFEAVLAGHQGMNLKLMFPDGRTIGAATGITVPELEVVQEFIPSPRLQEVWLSAEGDRERVRGISKVISTEQCVRCHSAGETLAVASMSMDVTNALQTVRKHSRRNVGLLLLAWAAALGGINALVRRSVQRFTSKFEEELAAAESGEGPASGAHRLVLDPHSAELQRSLQQFLQRQRRRQAEVATKLAHTDQLASLGSLAAGLAHEIKNPLAGIQGALEILREEPSVSDSNKELYDEMLSELKRVNGTLRSLLGSARPGPARLAKTDLNKLLDDVRILMAPGLRRQDVALELDLTEGPLEAQIDGSKIRQVLLNLIQNAAEAMEDGGTVTVRASDFPEGGGIVLAVQDDGPGIPPEQLKRVFEPFFSTKFSGTGLGLAIARSLVEQHGGTLQVDSEVGRGTNFYLILPGEETEEPPPVADEPESPNEEPES